MFMNNRSPYSSLWRLGSPQERALQAWRRCMASNEGKGFDVTVCRNPLTGEIPTATAEREPQRRSTGRGSFTLRLRFP